MESLRKKVINVALNMLLLTIVGRLGLAVIGSSFSNAEVSCLDKPALSLSDGAGHEMDVFDCSYRTEDELQKLIIEAVANSKYIIGAEGLDPSSDVVANILFVDPAFLWKERHAIHGKGYPVSMSSSAYTTIPDDPSVARFTVIQTNPFEFFNTSVNPITHIRGTSHQRLATNVEVLHLLTEQGSMTNSQFDQRNNNLVRKYFPEP